MERVGCLGRAEGSNFHGERKDQRQGHRNRFVRRSTGQTEKRPGADCSGGRSDSSQMTTSDQEIASLDLGNSTCRMGLYGNGEINRERFVSTKTFLSDPKSLTGQYPALPPTIAYCSVSPPAESALKDWAKTSGSKLFNLNDMTCGDFHHLSPPR